MTLHCRLAPSPALLAVLSALVAVASCQRPIAPTPPPPGPDVPGVLGGRCTDDGFCNDPLICVNDVCEVDPNNPGEGEGEG